MILTCAGPLRPGDFAGLGCAERRWHGGLFAGPVYAEPVRLAAFFIDEGARSGMALITGFPPVADVSARVLILGSMPGEASLQADQYYAHPRNAFWPIMGRLLGAGPELPYGERLERLKMAGVALWDVIGTCEREGSLDARIVAKSVQANDFAGFFAAHPGVSRVFFNGAAAETAFRRHVRAVLGESQLAFHRLPSTSPAHAGMAFAAKLAAWSVVVEIGVSGSV